MRRNCHRTACSVLAAICSFSHGAAGQQLPSVVNANAPMLDFGHACSDASKELYVADVRRAPPGTTMPGYLPNEPPTHPPYPPFAIRSGQEGTVFLSLYVTDDGRVGQVRLVNSSGWPLLDNAAMEGVRDWRLRPATKDNNTACMWVTAPVIFRLEDYSAAELAAVEITPEAEALAREVLGESMIEKMLTDQPIYFDEVTTEAMRRLFALLAAQPQWRESWREVAAALSIELTPDELREVQMHLSSPAMRKFYGVAPKFGGIVRRNQHRLGELTGCIATAVGESARKNVAIKVPEEQLSRRVLERMPMFVETLTPYCSCVATERASMGASARQDACGKAPELAW